MLNILLCDDNADELRRLVALLARSGQERVTALSNPEAALAHYQSGAPMDLAVLDILMPQMKGTELAAALRQAGYGGYLVFLTNSNDFASESYRAGAFDYLLKPVTVEAITQLFFRLDADSLYKDTAGITVTIDRTLRKVLFRDLIVAEAHNRQVRLALSGGEELLPYMTLRDCAARLLEDERFAYCHNSYVINMDYVETVTATAVVLRTGERIPISRSHGDFQTRYMKRLMSKRGMG